MKDENHSKHRNYSLNINAMDVYLNPMTQPSLVCLFSLSQATEFASKPSAQRISIVRRPNYTYKLNTNINYKSNIRHPFSFLNYDYKACYNSSEASIPTTVHIHTRTEKETTHFLFFHFNLQTLLWLLFA